MLFFVVSPSTSRVDVGGAAIKDQDMRLAVLYVTVFIILFVEGVYEISLDWILHEGRIHGPVQRSSRPRLIHLRVESLALRYFQRRHAYANGAYRRDHDDVLSAVGALHARRHLSLQGDDIFGLVEPFFSMI